MENKEKDKKTVVAAIIAIPLAGTGSLGRRRFSVIKWPNRVFADRVCKAA